MNTNGGLVGAGLGDSQPASFLFWVGEVVGG